MTLLHYEWRPVMAFAALVLASTFPGLTSLHQQEKDRENTLCELGRSSPGTFIGVLVDVSVRQRAVMEMVKSALDPFLREVIANDVCVSLVAFGNEVTEVQPWTASQSNSLQALNRMVADTSNRADSNRVHSRLNDAIYFAVVQKLSLPHGDKVLIVLAEGNDAGSDIPFKKALRAATENGVRCYSVLVATHGFRGSKSIRTFGWDLEKLSHKTHGRLFEPGDNRKRLYSALLRIASELPRPPTE